MLIRQSRISVRSLLRRISAFLVNRSWLLNAWYVQRLRIRFNQFDNPVPANHEKSACLSRNFPRSQRCTLHGSH